MFMNRIRRRRRRAERAVALAVQASDVVAELAETSAVLKAWLDSIALSAEDGNAATRLFTSVLRLDIHHAAGGEAVPRRQNSIQQTELLDEHGIDHRDERRIGVDIERHHDVVDFILKLRTLGVADVNLLILVDCDTRHLRQD